jgi:GDPmannose 4,6-dehydratase
MKKALITGINGQDGSYLAEFLLARGYEVHGIVRREAIEDSAHRLRNITHSMDRLTLHIGSLDNHLSLYRIVQAVRPEECYHLASSSFVSYSFDDESSHLSSTVNSTQCLLASIKELAPSCRFYFSGTSEMFGDAESSPQNENTKFSPRSLYGISKVAGHYLSVNYRRQHGLFACTGILYNHESPRRGYEFVTRKITAAAVRIHRGLMNTLELGNIDARRDWGYAPEYVEAMWRMLNHDRPEDYVIATGQLHSVRDFLEVAFSTLNLRYQDHLKINPAYFRPQERVPLVGDASRAARDLEWRPRKSFEVIVREMVESELALIGGQR